MPVQSLSRAPSGAQSGFTIIELMIVVVVMMIGVALAVPSFRELIRNSNVATNANDLIAALNVARTEAIKRGTRVAVISASGTENWTTGWSIAVDTARDGTYATSIRTHEALPTGYSIHVKATGGGAKNDRVVFDSSGGLTNGLKPPDMTNSAKSVTLTDINVCSQVSDKKKARVVKVITSGQVSSFRDATSNSTVTVSC
jgi:type II secretion system protein H